MLYKNEKCMKVGAFSAGSNITGTLFDVDRIAFLCHTNNALAIFDYAAVSPYQEINMMGPGSRQDFPDFDVTGKEELCAKDAVFLSPHKLVGGPGSSGVLIATKTLLYDKIPDRIGGGPVFFVNEKDHDFVANIEELEEAGTPGVIQDIRAGLVFQLREQVGVQTISSLEQSIKERVMNRFFQIPNLYLLGNNNLPKVPIFTFIIKTRFGKILHPFFVTSLLNDLFGIQTRSGCSCASMYGQKILGIDLSLSRRYKEALYEGHELLRMGYTRLNFNYFQTEADIDYVLEAVEFVCAYGWMFLPNYKFDVDLGIWVHRNEQEQQTRVWLGEIDYSQGFMGTRQIGVRSKLPFEITKAMPSLSHFIEEAKQQLVTTVESYKVSFGKSVVDQRLLVPEEY